jgi:hypothetical protein
MRNGRLRRWQHVARLRATLRLKLPDAIQAASALTVHKWVTTSRRNRLTLGSQSQPAHTLKVPHDLGLLTRATSASARALPGDVACTLRVISESYARLPAVLIGDFRRTPKQGPRLSTL